MEKQFSLDAVGPMADRPDLYFWGGPGESLNGILPGVDLVGCGSLGSAIAFCLSRSAPGFPHTTWRAIDHDRVSNRNLHNGFFFLHDLGLPKAQAVARNARTDNFRNAPRALDQGTGGFAAAYNHETQEDAVGYRKRENWFSRDVACLGTGGRLVILSTDTIDSRVHACVMTAGISSGLIDCRNAVDYTTVRHYRHPADALMRMPREEDIEMAGCGARGRMPLTMMTAALASDLAMKALRSYLMCAPPLPDVCYTVAMGGEVRMSNITEVMRPGKTAFLDLPPENIGAILTALCRAGKVMDGDGVITDPGSVVTPGYSVEIDEHDPIFIGVPGAGVILEIVNKYSPNDCHNINSGLPGILDRTTGQLLTGANMGELLSFCSLVRLAHLDDRFGRVHYDPKVWLSLGTDASDYANALDRCQERLPHENERRDGAYIPAACIAGPHKGEDNMNEGTDEGEYDELPEDDEGYDDALQPNGDDLREAPEQGVVEAVPAPAIAAPDHRPVWYRREITEGGPPF